MAPIRFTTTPSLNDAILVAAFKGWNDASEVATAAVKFLIRRWKARRFAELDPEEFFDFSETRPHVRYGRDGHRVIDWPITEFHFHRGVAAGRDVVLALGTEPNLRWRTFTDAIVNLGQTINVTTVVTLGGLLADVPHSGMPRLTGSASDTSLNERLQDLQVPGSRYEGPTGIVGVLNTRAREAGMATVSLWGNVPHYVSASPNPKVTHGLLHRLSTLLDLNLDLSEWDPTVSSFEAQVTEAIESNPEIAAYVRELEQADSSDFDTQAPPAGELPSGDAIVRELEDFLRRQRSDDEPER
ncbi:MAG TPA: PAC2 family protein [Chloroflexota bacterium]|nr:PAC2 family protein [Chloroflexota bacterium]